ncbi:MAG: hypothetical protein K5669_09640 [Lachnospiraceae bacterium]|nr:hypothetical protein [Lachnospiraceae bacterium]
MKKRLLALILSSALIAVLSGCSAKDSSQELPSEPIVTDNQNVSDDANTASSTESEVTEPASEPVSEPAADSGTSVFDEADTSAFTSETALASIERYKNFLLGNENVYVNATQYFNDGTYSYEDLLDGHKEGLDTDSLPSDLVSAEYAFIDCCLNGEPELLLKLTYDRGEEYSEQLIDYLVIRPMFDELTLICAKQTFYRSNTNINYAGYIIEDGSGGAAIYYSSSSFISSDGETYRLFSCTTYSGLSTPIIPMDALPISWIDDLVPANMEYSEDYTCDAYSFEDFREQNADEDYETYYEELVKNKYYVFYDAVSNGVMPDDDYMTKCSEYGLKICSHDDIIKMTDDILSSYGIDEKITAACAPTYYTFYTRQK